MRTEEVATIKAWLGTGSVNIFGRQLSGKDTQGLRLAAALNATFVSSGDVLRTQGDGRIRSEIDVGILANSAGYVALLGRHIRETVDPDIPVVLSSVGRLLEEAGAIVSVLEETGHPLRAVPELRITNEEALERFGVAGRNRVDETLEALEKRLAWHDEHVTQTLRWYEQQGLLVPVDGMPEKDVVFDALVRELAAKANRELSSSRAR